MIEPKLRAGWRSVPMLAILRDCLEAHLARVGRTGKDLVFGRTVEQAFYASTVDGRTKRAWKFANERERELAVREQREPDLLRPIGLHIHSRVPLAGLCAAHGFRESGYLAQLPLPL